MADDPIYQVALTMVPHIGTVHAKILINHFGEAKAIFTSREKDLGRIDGIGFIRARYISRFNNFSRAEEELRFIEKFQVRMFFLNAPGYPKRLLHCTDSPTLLYYRGAADLNAAKIISVIGTRCNSDYGKQLTETLVRELAPQEVTIVSGLAFGIDAIAHKAAIKNGLPTIGVLGHSLDKIYPPEHHSLAVEILQQGGLLTEFKSKTKPDKHNFPTRNRIVAGMSDATLVIETGLKGGSMITADLANGYNRDVFAIPGKTTDSKSAGCNYLIRSNKAALITDAAQLIDAMGWRDKKDSLRSYPGRIVPGANPG